jgi:quercetin dioxygenase-like cupin family protein
MGNPLEDADYEDVHEEGERWVRGDRQASYYQDFLDRSAENPLAAHGEGPLNKVLKPEDMPWEMSPQGLLKHMLNEDMAEEEDFPGMGADLYQQVIPPGSKSGKHRHRGEEIVIILEGEGHDLHWDAELTVVGEEDREEADWEFDDEPKKFEWEAGDAVYVPVNSIHQHVNTSDTEPARILSAQARAFTNLGFGYEDLEQFEAAPEYEG